jgi:DMSO/TMAO reductase YedYZ molybdopterin-dependent catalytic subunit
MISRVDHEGISPPLAPGEERRALKEMRPGFHLRPPPPPHRLTSSLTSDAELFETIHMGTAVVDEAAWRLAVDGLVRRPFSLTLEQLMRLPRTTLAAFHECYGSPLKPPLEALRRIGNVEWTGVRLGLILELAGVAAGARFVWSEGLDHGEFGGRTMDRYRKDLPLEKALAPEVLVAYAMNGEPLREERGAPARLVVPGWFGTNMTKWLCRLSVQADRAPGPFTNEWYNEPKPVWAVEPNSMIVEPAPGATVHGASLPVWGWAWSADGVAAVEVSSDSGSTWRPAQLAKRSGFEWQRFELTATLAHGENLLLARARSAAGALQPLTGRRNQVHAVSVTVR